MVAGKDMDDFQKMFPRPVEEETSSDEDEAPAAAGKSVPSDHCSTISLTLL